MWPLLALASLSGTSAYGSSREHGQRVSLPQLNASDMCGTWVQQDCEEAPCGTQKYQQVAYAFVNDWRGASYSFVTQEFADPHCKIYDRKHWELVTITLAGSFYLTGTDVYNSAWTNMVLYPTQITVLSEQEEDASTYTFPDGSCGDPMDYLNHNCPCGGKWRYGEERTIYFDQCDVGTCSIFRDIRQYAKVQLYVGHDHEKSWLGLTEPTMSMQYDSIQTPVARYTLYGEHGCMVTKAMRNCAEDPARCIREEPEEEEEKDERERWWEYMDPLQRVLFPRPNMKLGASGNANEANNVDCQREENWGHEDCQWYVDESSSSSVHIAEEVQVASDDEELFLVDQEEEEEITMVLIYLGTGLASALVSVGIGWYFCIQSLAKPPEATLGYNAINDRLVD